MLHLALALLLTTTIKGQVMLGGLPLPGATVTLVDLGGVPRVAVSDMNGEYHFDNVLLPYTVTAEMENMIVTEVQGTTIHMKLGPNAESSCENCPCTFACLPLAAEHAQYTVPFPKALPITRGFAGALALAPGVH